MTDAARAGVNVRIGRHHRHQHCVRIAHVFVEFVRLHRGGRVDDDAIGTVRHAQLKAPGHAERARIGGDAVDRGLVGRALFEPARARTLRIEIHQDGPVAAGRIHGSDASCDRGLARSAFRVEQDNAEHGTPRAVEPDYLSRLAAHILDKNTFNANDLRHQNLESSSLARVSAASPSPRGSGASTPISR